VKIIPYEEKYRKAVQDICIETGSKDNLVNQEHHDFTLLMYCDPYLDHGRCFVLLDEEDQPQGYIMACEDGRKFLPEMEPYFQKIRKVAPSFAYRCDVSEYQKYVEEYPAHLHIDIRESYTGGGRGSALMKTLLDVLQKDGVRGIMVGVGSENTRAYNFYQKMGFQVLEKGRYGAVLGKKL
jgi:ribosomal protein S18 acetylase RimI-like enzyme